MSAGVIAVFGLHAAGALLILVLTAFLIKALFDAPGRRGRAGNRARALEAALAVPALRYARGEIDEISYRRITEDLKSIL